MRYILSFIYDMFPYILISIPIIIIVRFIIYKKENKFNLKREILLFIFIIYMVGLLSQTLKTGNKHEINIIPFKIIYDSYKELLDGNIYYLLISFLANIIIFIPIGILLPILYNLKDKHIILIGFCISLFIEIIQFFLNRTTDIDDLILNTFGVVIGLIISKKIKKVIDF